MTVLRNNKRENDSLSPRILAPDPSSLTPNAPQSALDLAGDKGHTAAMLSRHGLQLRKSMGQNFLVDPNISEKMVRLSGIDETCGVLEIGPGAGALTRELGRVAKKVITVELDNRLIPILNDTFSKSSNIQIIQGDVLKLDIESLISEKMKDLRCHVCANLPYNITTPAISTVIDAGVFETITVMVQKEVAERICSAPGSPEYGAFTVYANYHAESEILFSVSPECFMPRPKVHSAVIKMSLREKRLLSKENEKKFFSVVRAAFGQRRKTLVNALHAAFGSSMEKQQITEKVKICGFDTKVRGEVLSLADFIVLSAML